MFEPRLRTYLVALSALAASTARGEAPEEPSVCDVAMYPADSGEPETYEGFVKVGADEDCPDLADVRNVNEGCACPTHRLLEACALVDERTVGGGGCAGVEPEKKCTYAVAGVSTGACCGRPLLRDDGHAALAPVVSGGGWAANIAVDGELAPEARAAVVAWWLEAARMEHASVASFARATLELMALGAPPDLLRDTQLAAADEVAHAQLCFGLASAVSGQAHRPGPLPVDRLAVRIDPVAIAVATAREGCIGETLAAVDAHARLIGATEPAVRQVLERIVGDESRHAALAWRTLEWLLAEHGASVREAVDAVFAAEPAPNAGTVAVPSHGVIDAHLRDRLQADAHRDLVRPSWLALRAGTPGHRAPTAPAAETSAPPMPSPRVEGDDAVR